MKQEKFNVGTVILAIIITAVVVGGGVYMWQNQKATELMPYNGAPGPSDPAEQQATTNQPVDEPAKVTTKTYRSSQFSYSFQYPENWFLTKGQSIEAQPEVVWISEKEIMYEEPNPELSIAINRSSLESNMRENLISREEITFAGQSATKINFTGDFGPPIVSILIPQNDYTFVISYDPANQNYPGIESILNSFSFTY